MVQKFLSRWGIANTIDGERGEALALNYLQQQGLTLVARNYRCRRGELDLIMQQGDTVVFVEVRYRQRNDFGGAAASVSASKQKKCLLAAAHFLQNEKKYAKLGARFDVIAIQGHDQNDTLSINWIINAFTD
jgi:putative endonuclease